MKSHATITVESDILEKAKKDPLLNVSAICEHAIKEQLSIDKVSISKDIEGCEFCGRKMKQAYVDKKQKYHDGLSWLYPDEKWICPKCLLSKSKNITK